jgi:hypothetical protein
MKARFLLLLCAVLLSLPVWAQGSSRVEVFGGYSYTGYSVYDQYSGPWERFGYNGWAASAAVKLAPYVGVEANFTGGYGSPYGPSTSLRTYMGGPRISTDVGRVGIYGHLLFGGLTFVDQRISLTATSFATAVGGGANYWFSRRIGVRVIDFDYLRNTNNAAGQGLATKGGGNHFRLSTGIVFRFGR